MQPRIEMLSSKQLAGKRLTMSLSENRTMELWKSFMARRREIQHIKGADLYSLQVYPPSYFAHFDPATPFEKWALAEVSSTVDIPADMETFHLPAGLYAVFHHKGAAETATRTFGYIFHSWLPSSPYELDQRPHFEILGEKYRNGDPNSEEEIWIPIRSKGANADQ